MANQKIIVPSSVGWLAQKIHTNVKKTCERHYPNDPMMMAITLELYEEYLGGLFQKQMSETFGIKYPLNLNIKSLEELGKTV